MDSSGQINFTADDLGGVGGPYLQGNDAIFLPNVGGPPTPLTACTSGVGPPVIPAPDQPHQHHHHHHHHGPADLSAKIPGKKAKPSAAKKKDLEQQDLVDKRSDLFAQLDAAGGPGAAGAAVPGGLPPMDGYTTSVDLDSETESNHDTALTLACAGGHEELVKLLLDRGADIGKNICLMTSTLYPET